MTTREWSNTLSHIFIHHLWTYDRMAGQKYVILHSISLFTSIYTSRLRRSILMHGAQPAIPNFSTELANHLQWHMDHMWSTSPQTQLALANPHPHNDHPWGGIRMPHTTFRADQLKTVVVHKEQRNTHTETNTQDIFGPPMDTWWKRHDTLITHISKANTQHPIYGNLP